MNIGRFAVADVPCVKRRRHDVRVGHLFSYVIWICGLFFRDNTRSLDFARDDSILRDDGILRWVIAR
jgi:hypothetical protein